MYAALLVCLICNFYTVHTSTTPEAAKINEFPGSTCRSDDDCVVEGKCVPLNSNSTLGYCRCFRSCPAITPRVCVRDADCHPGNYYRNVCNVYKNRCMCPSSVQKEEMCTKRDVSITSVYADDDSPYAGVKLLRLHCCINVDSRSVFLRFYHNNSHELIPTKTPIDALNRDRPYSDPSFYDNCWHFEVRNVRFRDSGIYSCNVSIGEDFQHVVKNRAILVREQIKIHLTASNVTSNSVKIKWKTSPMNFSVNIRLTETMQETVLTGEWINSKSGVVNAYNLKPATFYLVTATTEKTHNHLSDSDKVRFKTLEDLPEPPTYAELMADNKQFTKCEMSWRAPTKTNGKIIRYEVHLSGVIRAQPGAGVVATPHRPQSDDCLDLMNVPPDYFKTCQFSQLLPNRNYTGYVVAVNSAGKSARAVINQTCMSNYGRPDTMAVPRVTKLVSNHTTPLLTVQFASQDQSNGPIVCYYMAVVPLPWDSAIDNLPSPANLEFTGDARESFTAVSKRYKRKKEGLTDDNSLVAYIAESYEELPASTVLGDRNQSVSQCGVWYDGRYGSDDVPLRSGYRYTGFMIVRVEPDKSLNFLDAIKNRFRLKRTAWQLQPVYGYSNYFTPVVMGEVPATFSDDSPTSSPILIVLPILFFLLLMILIVGLVYHFRRRHWWKDCFLNRNPVPDRGSFVELSKRQRDFQPIAVEDLPAEYLLRHRDSDFLFAMEFEALPHYSNFDTLASDLPDNSRKNRYNDIKAYDVTRVKLNVLNENPISDYINANFIQGYRGRKSFIAAQGPLADTVADFWRMVWEQNISIVIMVANLYEKYRAQCTQYWPEDEATKYGGLLIRPVDAQHYSDYTIRKFEIKKALSDSGHIYDTVHSEANESMSLNPNDCTVRTVVQYHYTGWHDYRAPECTTGLLRFLMRLRKLTDFSDSIVAVHCSAGVGRTGTFIAIDGVIDQCLEEGRADVYGFVSNMRRQRNFMVQSLEQYVFVYKALAEWYSFGDTDIEVEKIREHVKMLRTHPSSPSRRHHEEQTPMRLEYQKLSGSLENGVSCEFALKECNGAKNRFGDVVPLDRNRVILPPLLGTVDASYINASLIRGYSHAYILAQDPLQSTRWDMWRMICEHNATCVVSLTKEDTIPHDEKYWPDEGGVVFGDKPSISVRLICEERCPNFVTRRLSFSHPKEKELREITHFSYSDWPNSCDGQVCVVPKTTSSLLELIGKVLQRQTTHDDTGTVVVHCSDGSSRAGLYTAVSLILQRLKAEGRVDVLQTVKSLQAQRPKVLNSLAQYEFCYQAVLDYLESFC